MSTVNVQNLLSNVFHPTYVYDTVNRVYKTNLELVNVDTVSANTVSSFFASIGDAQSNVYVGIGAGVAHSNMVSSSNYNTTFLGPGAGNTTSNVNSSIFIGYNAGQNSTGGSLNTIAIGTLTDGDGTNNIYIGKNTGVSNSIGSNNIFIGHDITISNFTNNSNQFLLGPKVKPSGNIGDELGSNYLLGGNFTNNFLGINLSNPEYTLDVNGYARIGTNQIGGLGINTDPLEYTLNVNGNMQVSDGSGIMTFTSDLNSNSVTTITPVLSNKTATLQVNDGFFSLSGTTGTVGAGATSNIGVWKKGIVMVSVQHSTDNTIFASRLAMVSLSNTTYTVTSMTTAMNSNVTISNDSNNIILSNSGGVSRTYTYSITYFPLP
jgi:trimeric autotransporter adhesin